eukprot:TRINITY_DN470_c0_g1_i1.p1 TRINITY_DN470_c0_g1~~TRINITY_DN470_c0_g1_i1.p1  ORF type:complete len:444 (-),score=114.16 TRINITY_DN470_c0_g1_i1:11-1342(-)
MAEKKSEDSVDDADQDDIVHGDCVADKEEVGNDHVEEKDDMASGSVDVGDGVMKCEDHPPSSVRLHSRFDENVFDSWDMDIPLSVMLMECVERPIISYAESVHRFGLTHILGELKLLYHLGTLRDYFLMGRGDLFDVFCTEIFEKMDRCEPSLTTAVLQDALENALQSIDGDGDCSIEISMGSGMDIQGENSRQFWEDPGVLRGRLDPYDSMCGKYNGAIDSLKCIITTDHMQNGYIPLFRLFWKVRRVAHALQHIKKLLKHPRIRAFQLGEKGVMQIHYLAFEMHWFVQEISSYWRRWVIDDGWEEMRKNMVSATRVEDLLQFHQRYLDGCVERCMISSRFENVFRIVLSIFDVVMRFRTRIEQAMDGIDGEDPRLRPFHDDVMSDVAHLRKLFVQFRQFLGLVLTKMHEKRAKLLVSASVIDVGWEELVWRLSQMADHNTT